MTLKNISLDLKYVKSQFPAFEDPLSAKWTFFENAGGSYVPHNVITHLNKFMTSTKVQPYAEFETSNIAGNNIKALAAATHNKIRITVINGLISGIGIW